MSIIKKPTRESLKRKEKESQVEEGGLVKGAGVLKIKPGSLYYTDNWHAYASLSVRGKHVVISKEKGMAKGRDYSKWY